MISLRDYLAEFWYPQAFRTKGKGNSESFQGLDKSRRNPRGPGRGQGHQEEAWSSRSHADRQGPVVGGLGDVVVPRDLGRHSFSTVECGIGRVWGGGGRES